MLLRFINREKELRFLRERNSSSSAELVPVYGRRRIGKTETIKQFIKNKPHFYFLAREIDLAIERNRFLKEFSSKFNVFLDNSNSWESIFNGITEKVLRNSKEKFVIAIDEFPYWIKRDKTVVSEFQHVWDEILSKENVFLVLCGSSVGMMETDVIGYKSPLYGRRTGQIKLNELSFKNFSKFFPDLNTEETMKFYGALGGTPFYIKEFDSKNIFIQNIEKTFWNSHSVLNAEAEFLLKEELREVERYLRILRAVFEGSTKLNEIATKSGIDITNINKYLSTLLNLGFIKREYPAITNKPKRKNFIYAVSDNYFRFWLNYVYPFQSDIEISEISAPKRFLEKDYNSYMGKIFEEICKEFLILSKGLFNFSKIGRWWYKDKEIDLIALNESEKKAFFVECKWKNKVNPFKELKKLKEKAGFVDWHSSKRKEFYCIIAKSFYIPKKKLKEKNFFLFDLKDLEKAFKKK